MPIIFCYIDPFALKQQVIKISANNTEQIYSGSIDEISHYIAFIYNDEDYQKIILKGSLAENIADQIRLYAMTDYNKNKIEIEVI